ncbi:MAG: hypothetical protein WCT37_03745 [Patescibacteria group bacterium]|jgi:hypothetical protein
MSDSQFNNLIDDIPVRDTAGGFSVLGQGKVDAPASVVVPAIDAALVLADRIASELNLSFADEVLARRFKNLVLTAVKEIRNPAQTLEMLVKEPSAGGLGLNVEVAKKVLEKIGGKNSASAKATADRQEVIKPFTRQELDHELPPPTPMVRPKGLAGGLGAGLGALVSNKSMSAALPPKPLVSANLPPKKIFSRAEIKPFRDNPSKVEKTSGNERYLSGKVKPFIEASRPPKPLPKPNWLTKFKDKFSPKIKAPTAVKPQAPAPVENISRGKITDIKLPGRLIGPVEELQNLRLEDWRALGSDPTVACSRIKEKIDLLATESIAKKLAGIEAWQRSEVFRLYLTLGKASLETGQPLSAVMASRERQKQPVLTLSEFAALGKLNKMLE